MQTIFELATELRVYSLVGVTSSHLVVRHGRGLLIDCHSGQMTRWLNRRGLPAPEMILHTHVQPEHCREADQFSEASILVHEQLKELACERVAYEKAAHTVWDNPAEWMKTLGQEKYGVAGSITVFPPEEPLSVSSTFR